MSGPATSPPASGRPDADCCARCGNQFPPGQVCDRCRQHERLPIWERVLRETGHLFHPYHEHQQPQEAPVSLLTTVVHDAENFFGDHLGKLRQIDSTIAGSRLVQLALAITGMVDPAIEVIAEKALEAFAPAAPQLEPLPAAGAAPSDVLPEPLPEPVGPVTGGQAA